MQVSHKYPGIVLGFSTQNFMKSMPPGVDNLKELLDFASVEGFAFIELRDPSADLSEDDCRILAEYAVKKQVEVIYEIHKDLFDPEFQKVFDRAIRNTMIFGEPGILRSILSWSEFAADKNKKGWSLEELDYLTTTADSCAKTAKVQDISLIFENIIEPWFGQEDDFGLAEFFDRTSLVGLQFDTANPFLSSCRRVADPESVAGYLSTISGRWLTTHLKCAAEDSFQAVLKGNPLPYERVFELMEAQGVSYAALELLAVDSKEACFENHRKSIDYLIGKNLVEPSIG
ncbi:MAG: hypothetical protein ABFS28_04235 [Bacteroidota bacterium]